MAKDESCRSAKQDVFIDQVPLKSFTSQWEKDLDMK